MEDYEMITRLGGGSFADVYKAREKSTGEYVAIKILKRIWNFVNVNLFKSFIQKVFPIKKVKKT